MLRIKSRAVVVILLLLLCSCGPVGVVPAMAALAGKNSSGDDDDLPAVYQRTWIEKFPLTSPSKRDGHAMVYDSTHEVTVLFGGRSGTYNDDIWEWDGTGWAQKFPIEKPMARIGHTIAYDSERNVAVLFGGVNSSSHLNDTWEWDGDNWVDVSPIGTEGIDFPSQRQVYSMVYDSARQVVVLFGGCYYDGTYTNYNDTWEWDGTNWTERFSVDVPSPRRAHAMVYDSIHGVVVLFGGYNNTENLDDIWEWDGTNWIEKFSANIPSPRFWHSMVYNFKRGQVMLFGGCYYDGMYTYYDDTWGWNGIDWIQKFPENKPSGRRFHAMAYDSKRDATVLFGGYDGSVFGDTWEY